MSVRKATLEDIPRCIEYAKTFHAASPHSKTSFSEEKTRETLQMLIENPDGILLVGREGFIGGMIAEMMFNYERIAYEMFWWAKSGGMDLVKAFERVAELNGAVPMMACLEDASAARMAKLYARRGYIPTERYFIKR